MNTSSFMDKLRSFLGFRQEPPRNDFRNPIWGSDDEDDGDELYTRHQMNPYMDPAELHRQINKQMLDLFKNFGSMFGDAKLFFQDDQFDSLTGFGDIPEPEDYNNSNRIRDYYLKPGYQIPKQEQPKEDIDLDGKVSSHEISGLLNQKDNQKDITSFDGTLVPGRSFCRTIITTSVTKPDGTIETTRIVKNGNEVIQETTTSGPEGRPPFNTELDSFSPTSLLNNNILSDFASLFRNFY